MVQNKNMNCKEEKKIQSTRMMKLKLRHTTSKLYRQKVPPTPGQCVRNFPFFSILFWTQHVVLQCTRVCAWKRKKDRERAREWERVREGKRGSSAASVERMMKPQTVWWNTSAAPFSHALCLFKVISEKGICIGKRNSECKELWVPVASGPASTAIGKRKKERKKIPQVVTRNHQHKEHDILLPHFGKLLDNYSKRLSADAKKNKTAKFVKKIFSNKSRDLETF